MNRRIKILTTVALLAAVTLSLWGCGENKAETQQGQSKQTIDIPQVTVDLQNPENKVDVPVQESSKVFDENGQQLSDNEWLLNSKFAKSYIQSLGAGSYTFTYESAAATGTIYLTVTDEEKPNYVFSTDIPQTVDYLNSLFLPRLVKEQDSYQGDYEVRYQLRCAETEVELLEKPDGFQTEALEAGDYVWTATLSVDGTEHTYTHSFHVQSFDEYLQANLDTLFFDEQAKVHLAAQEGVFTVNTQDNADIFRYTVSQSIIEKAISAGKTWVVLTIAVDKPYAAEAAGENKGSFWMTDSWNQYNIGCNSLTPYTDDLRNRGISAVVSMAKKDGKYVYCMEGDLRLGYFTESTPLQYFFADGIQCQAQMTLSFK
ncbi:MAG: hypothetical protein IJO28_02060 [Oscillospiraceae bacterium]|nr:hypothetical protein [Oscillospiraceae bacterium]